MRSPLRCRLWILACLLGLAASPAEGAYTTSQAMFEVLSDVVVDADAQRPTPPGRSVIRAQVTLTYLRNPATDPNAQTFALNWSLLGPADEVVASGNSTQAVAWSDAGFPHTTAERTSTCALAPPSALDPGKPYRLRVVVTPASNGTSGTHTQATGLYFYHFTNPSGGDVSLNVQGRIASAALSRAYAITGETNGWPLATVTAPLARYDDFDLGPANATFPIRLRVSLVETAGPGAPNPVPLIADTVTVPVTLASYLANDAPATLTASLSRALQPQSMFSRSGIYQATLVLDYQNADGAYVPLGTQALPPQAIFPVSGVIRFGTVEARFSELEGVPAPQGANWTLAIPAGRAHVTNHESLTFGGSFLVSLDATGNATVVSGSAVLPGGGGDTGPADSKVRVKWENITLTPVGATAAKLTVYLPAGFGIGTLPVNAPTTSPETHASGKVVFLNPSLNAALLPGEVVNLDALSVRRGVDPGATGATAGLFYCVHEKLPLWFKASAVSWNTTTGEFLATPHGSGEFRWVREGPMSVNEALHTLPSGPGNPPLLATDSRPSNDTLFAKAHEAGLLTEKQFSVKANAKGVGMLSARVPLSNTQVRPHYPLGIADGALEGYSIVAGQLTINSGVVDTNTSLMATAGVTQTYARDPRGQSPCANAGPGSFVFRPLANTLRFTQDLGVLAEGSVDTKPLAWGTVRLDAGNTPVFAHQTNSFTAASFYQPGLTWDGSNWARTNDDRPGALLLTGRGKPGDMAYVERPFHDDHLYEEAGLANYAGLNLRASMEPAGFSSRSVVCNSLLGPYELTTRSKYYVNQGGVTGIHERVTSSALLNVRLYKFPVNLTDFKFSYLDNKVRDSFTNGRLEVPFPAGFTLDFESLQLTERGQPHAARLSSALPAPLPDLDHWGNLPFTPLSLGFREQPLTNPCAPPQADQGYLEVGATFSGLLGGLVPGPVHASLGFKAEQTPGGTYGHLVVAADGIAGLDSKIPLPPSLVFDVPGDANLHLTTVTKASFSSSAGITNPANINGFLSVAGYLQVPFFRELEVHTHVQPAGDDPGVHFMGGWTAGNGKTFFSDPDGFDAFQLGAPLGTSVAAYRHPPDVNSDTFRVIARKNWMNVVSFKYPLTWAKGLMRFESARRPPATALVLFDLEHKLRSLSANGAELEFGAEIPGLPQINPQRLILDQVDGLGGSALFGTFDTALRNATAQTLSATGLTHAVTAVDSLITDRLDRIFDEVLDGPVDAMLSTLLAEMEQDFASGAGQSLSAISPGDFSVELGNRLTAGRVEQALNSSVGTANLAQGLVGKVNTRLNTAKAGIDTLQALIAPDATGRRAFFRNLVHQLADDHTAYSLISAAGGFLDQELRKLEVIQGVENNPFFGELHQALQEAENQITAFQAQASSLFLQPLNQISAQESVLLAGTIQGQIGRVVGSVVPPEVSDLRDYLGPGAGANRARLHEALKRMIRDRILASAVADRALNLLRSHFASTRGVLREGLDQILSQVTTTVKEAFTEQLLTVGGDANPLKNFIGRDSPLRGLGALGDAFQGAQLRGYARTVGHSIAELRLDGGIKMKPPGMGNGMEFTGYFIFKDNQKPGPVMECMSGLPGAKTEVLAGARMGSRSKPQPNPVQGKDSTSFFDNMAVAGNLHFALSEDGMPAGFRGDLEFRGPLTIGIVGIDGVNLSANFSQQNQYLRGVADGRILELIQARVDMFAGHACDISQLGTIQGPLAEALKLSTFNAGQSINSNNLAGIVCRIDGSISVNDVLKRYGSLDIPREIVDIGFAKTTIYALLKKPSPELKFYLGYLEGGKVTAKTAIYTLADASLQLAGVAQAEISLENLAASVINPAGLINSLAIQGEASFDGPIGGFPSLDLKIGGVLHRRGLRFNTLEWSLMGVPLEIDLDGLNPF